MWGLELAAGRDVVAEAWGACRQPGVMMWLLDNLEPSDGAWWRQRTRAWEWQSGASRRVADMRRVRPVVTLRMVLERGAAVRAPAVAT